VAAQPVPSDLGPPFVAVSFHPEILKARQRDVLQGLGPAASHHGFYLGGGTAIALRLAANSPGSRIWHA
jgi:hypothetical protein